MTTEARGRDDEASRASPASRAAIKRAAIKRTPRPRDRKAQIVATARRLFAANGYAAVSADDIASSVGITAGALYRHFDGKQDLLVHTLIDALDAASLGVRNQEATDLDSVVRPLTEVATSSREIGVLWTREIRLLDDPHRAIVRRHFFDVFSVVRDRLAQVRTDLGATEVDLLTWSVFAVLTSTSYHGAAISPQVVDLLHSLALRTCTVKLVAASSDEASPTAGGLLPHSRREQILHHAATLFHERGFASTSLADIGERAGMTGAGIYRHFPAKGDVLTALLGRGVAALQVQLFDALEQSRDARHALGELLAGYTAFAFRHPALVGILLTEVRELASDDMAGIRRAQREYLGEWEHLLRVVQPDLGATEARVTVVAALTVVNDATRTAQLRTHAVLPANLGRIGRELLGIAD